MKRSIQRVAVLCALVGATTGQQWVPIDQAPAARAGFGMVTDTVRGRILMFDGWGREDTWVFDGTVWTQLQTNQPPRRRGIAAAFDSARGRVVQFGGRDPEVEWPVPNDTWELAGTTWLQIPTAVAPSPRMNHGMAYDAARGETVLFGGYGLPSGPFLTDTWVWNGTSWTLRTPAQSPPGLWTPAMAYDASRQRVVLHDSYFPATWEWDGTNWHQMSPQTNPSWRHNFTLMYRPDTQRVMLFGGERGPNDPFLSDTWQYDGTTWTQLVTSSTPPGRAGHGLAWDPVNERPTIFAGMAVPGSGAAHDDTWALAGNAWTLVPTPAEPRGISSMVYDSSRSRFVAISWGLTWEFDSRWQLVPTPTYPPFNWYQRIAFDSWRQVTVTLAGQAWEWNGSLWQQRPTVHVPPQRYDFGIAFDPSRGVVVLFGGYFFQPYNDTWEYDGIDWTQRAVAYAPPPLQGVAMAFHRPTNRIVMFGGGPLGGPTNGTYEYNGVTWTPRFPSVVPTSRSWAALVPDPLTGDLILSGGLGNLYTPQLLRDAWRWNGNNWSPTPPQRFYASAQQPAAADPLNAMMSDGERWWRWTYQPATTPTTSGNGCGNPPPELVVEGRPFLGNPWFRVHVEPTPPNAIFALFVDNSAASIALGVGCTQYLANPYPFAVGCATPSGHGSLTIPLPRAAWLRGCVVHAQGVVCVPGGPLAGIAALTALRTIVLAD